MSMTVTVSSSARPYSHSRSMEELANDLFVVSPSATRHAKGSQAPAQVVDPNQTRRAPQERETQLESDPDTDSTLADGTESQAEQLMVHYAQLIGQKWACPAPGHNICVVSADVDGSWVHFQLSDDNISSWVEALCIGTATPSEPPPDVLASFLSSTDIDTASISSRSTIRPPSQTHTRAASSSTASIISVWVGALGSSTYSPSSSSSGSTIRPFPSPTSTIAAPHSSTPTIRAHPSRTPSAPPRSSWSPYSSFLPSLAESSPSQANRQGVPSSRDALKKIGKGGLGTLQATKRGHTHLSCIKKWEKKAANKLGPGERARVREMLDDALEMCRDNHPPRIHKLAYSIARAVQQWLHAFPDLEHTGDVEVERLLIQVQICMIPILLTRIARIPRASDPLAQALITALTRAPLALHDDTMTAEAVRIALEGVCLGAYAKKPYNSGNSMYSRDSTQDSTENFTDGSESHPYIHKSPTTPPKPATGLSDSEGDEDPHPWLGVHLLRIVEMTLHVRTLTPGEIDAVWELAERQERKPSTVTRPWQVALFALCSLKHAVLGPAGLPALIATLDSMLAPQVPAGAVIWEDVALTLRALAFLSEHAWVAESVGGEFVVSLLGVFRRPIPARWLCIRFWAMDTTRNITAHCPSLVRTLVREDAARAFATLAAAPVPAPSSPSSPSSSSLPSTPTRSRISVNSTMSMNSGQGARPGSSSSQRPADPETAPTRDRLLEGYKREAARRAEELAAYIKNWTEWESFGAGTGPGALEPVSIVGTF